MSLAPEGGGAEKGGSFRGAQIVEVFVGRKKGGGRLSKRKRARNHNNQTKNKEQLRKEKKVKKIPAGHKVGSEEEIKGTPPLN